MTPSRRKYLESISAEEKAVRAYISDTKASIRNYKESLFDAYNIIPKTNEKYSYYIAEFKAYLKISRKILAMLKNQLPRKQ